MSDSRLAYLFQVYFNKTASSNERDELMALLEKVENDEQLKALLTNAWEQTHLTSTVFDTNQGKEILTKILQTQKENEPVPVISIQRRIFSLRRIAAAVAILLVVSAGIYFLVDKRSKQEIAQTDSGADKKEIIVPGGDKAILTLADGSTIVLDTLHNGSLPQQGNTRIIKLNKGALAYNTGEDNEKEVLYNTLSTPTGGQFQLVLPDGSKVWLNSSSSIRFPTEFKGEDRKVELTGEAYFEVATSIFPGGRGKKKPFMVMVRGMEVEVLGTHFNIMAYDDERSINTTLLEGSVKIVKGVSAKVLTPGQQSRAGASSDIKVVDADVEEAIAWKNGYFQFNSYDIETIMRQVARWYDIKVVYKDKVPAGNFSGTINRKNNISRVLKILRDGGVQLQVEGKKVTIL